MDIFPAIDIKDGKVVRLTQGDYDKVDIYNTSPCEVAKEFEAKGAKFLHVVDLDGAKDGTLANFEKISEIVKGTNLFIEVGGGIRDEERIKKYLEVGVKRVILGTIAIKNPEFFKEMVEKYKEAIVLGVDAKDGMVAIDGWLTKTTEDSFEFCKKAKEIGVSTIIYTDIATDGAMNGTNLKAFEKLREIKDLNIVASGGICSLDEIKILNDMGIDGAIIGKAIYEGVLTLEEVVREVG